MTEENFLTYVHRSLEENGQNVCNDIIHEACCICSSGHSCGYDADWPPSIDDYVKIKNGEYLINISGGWRADHSEDDVWKFSGKYKAKLKGAHPGGRNYLDFKLIECYVEEKL